MKYGYFWCDPCDENAYGQHCQHCHRPARWIAAPNYGGAARESVRNIYGGTAVTVVTAQDWFERMREAVARA